MNSQEIILMFSICHLMFFYREAVSEQRRYGTLRGQMYHISLLVVSVSCLLLINHKAVMYGTATARLPGSLVVAVQLVICLTFF